MLLNSGLVIASPSNAQHHTEALIMAPLRSGLRNMPESGAELYKMRPGVLNLCRESALCFGCQSVEPQVVVTVILGF